MDRVDQLIPLATFILGLIGGLVSEWFRDRRVHQRDQLLLQFERETRRAEFQRATLLELQDVIKPLSESIITIYMALPHEPEPGVRQQHWDAQAQINALAERVSDDQLRALLLDLVHKTSEVTMAEPGCSADDALYIAKTANHAVQNRLGIVLRSLL